MTSSTEPTTAAGLDAAWESLAQDIHAHGYSVRDAIRDHRAAIEAEARQQDASALTRERLNDLHRKERLRWGPENARGIDLFASVIADELRDAALPPSTPPALDVERLEHALPEDAVTPYSDWSADNLARHIAIEYARLEQDHV